MWFSGETDLDWVLGELQAQAAKSQPTIPA